VGKFIDLMGKRFGRLMATSRVPQGDTKGAAKWNCVCDCGKKTVVVSSDLRSGHTKSCGCYNKDIIKKRLARGPTHPAWLGGEYKAKDTGYVRIRNPNRSDADKREYVQKHVFIMSEFLGRLLVKGESVHHKNGIRDDNRLENLELWVHGHPYGQRAEDRAVELLKKLGYIVLKRKE
jgi:hypothetical protein